MLSMTYSRGPSSRALNTPPELRPYPSNHNNSSNLNDYLPLPANKSTFLKSQIPHTNTMARGDAAQTKVHYKGKAEDFIIFVDSSEAVQEWKKDSSVPLAQVVSGFKILVTDK